MINEKENKTFPFEEDPSGKGAQEKGKKHHEVLFFFNFTQPKPQVKKYNMKYYDFYHTVFENMNEKGEVDKDIFETSEY